MSSDNVAHRIYDLWHSTMPLQLVLAYLRIRRVTVARAKERVLRALAVALHAIIGISQT